MISPIGANDDQLDSWVHLLDQNDLLDFNRNSLGFGIPVKPEPIDLAEACSQASARDLL